MQYIIEIPAFIVHKTTHRLYIVINSAFLLLTKLNGNSTEYKINTATYINLVFRAAFMRIEFQVGIDNCLDSNRFLKFPRWSVASPMGGRHRFHSVDIRQ